MKILSTNFFLTGNIGIGKTTIINKILVELLPYKIKTDGFRTEAIIENDVVAGYCFYRFNEPRQVFAHIEFESQQQFSHYKVTPTFFDEIGANSVKNAFKSGDLIVMDEIGAMERKSYKFQNAILDCLNSKKIVLGTFQKRAKWFYDLINIRKDSEIIEVTVNNRDNIHNKLLFNIKNNFC